jgi:DNA-directed RNA polymerase specialized sigma24 family protein
MSSMMAPSPDRSLATRESLLRRLTDCQDQASWQEFYAMYRDLIWRFALKAGCTESEAEEVVQETVIAVARKLPEFKYDTVSARSGTFILVSKCALRRTSARSPRAVVAGPVTTPPVHREGTAIQWRKNEARRFWRAAPSRRRSGLRSPARCHVPDKPLGTSQEFTAA